MYQSEVKQIELRDWDVQRRVQHSVVGRRYALRVCYRLADALLRQAEPLQSLSDDELLRQGREMYIRPSNNDDGWNPHRSAFPLVLEAIRRHTGFVLHHNQVMGAIAMRRGQMIEMATGEGKTLTALLAAADYAMHGQPVHMITANAYLAERDSVLGADVLKRLGLSAGFLSPKATPDEKLVLYKRSLLYTTLHEVGFDWLRDRLAMTRDNKPGKMRPLRVALIDEADMIMIDEARTPMVLAERTDPPAKYIQLHQWARETAERMQLDIDYDVHGPMQVELLEDAKKSIDRGRSLQDAHDAERAVMASLRARLFYRRDIDYIVRENEVIIVDPKTGRAMPGRRWPDGLHEAVMLREGLKLDGPTKHVAAVTVQQFLTQYELLCGCSGTMYDAAEELWRVYGVSTMQIPTHKPCIREVHDPRVYVTRAEQFRAVAEEVRDMLEIGRSVLVGTTHIETSIRLSNLLREMDIEHDVLNAHREEEEAEIIAKAGEPRRVTIATNMAGRGTDIKLEATVCEAGGLHVIAMQKHDSVRVDRQLFGRCARQGDPGSARFILSLQDPLLKEHAPQDRLKFRLRRVPFGAEVDPHRPLRLWRRVQREVETKHRESRTALIERQLEMDQLLGKPSYM
ncbi:MAG: preprotein translocase subunit SecA [Phycisphaera sp.]|nr:preprotein translocase subunit SecA [Phycisphaera sp.]